MKFSTRHHNKVVFCDTNFGIKFNFTNLHNTREILVSCKNWTKMFKKESLIGKFIVYFHIDLRNKMRALPWRENKVQLFHNFESNVIFQHQPPEALGFVVRPPSPFSAVLIEIHNNLMVCVWRFSACIFTLAECEESRALQLHGCLSRIYNFSHFAHRRLSAHSSARQPNSEARRAEKNENNEYNEGKFSTLFRLFHGTIFYVFFPLLSLSLPLDVVCFAYFLQLNVSSYSSGLPLSRLRRVDVLSLLQN